MGVDFTYLRHYSSVPIRHISNLEIIMKRNMAGVCYYQYPENTPESIKLADSLVQALNYYNIDACLIAIPDGYFMIDSQKVPYHMHIYCSDVTLSLSPIKTGDKNQDILVTFNSVIESCLNIFLRLDKMNPIARIGVLSVASNHKRLEDKHELVVECAIVYKSTHSKNKQLNKSEFG